MKPGLYVATVRGMDGVQVLGPDHDGWWALIDGDGDNAEAAAAMPGDVSNLRPLVVLDPGSDDDRRRIANAMRKANRSYVVTREDLAAEILAGLAEAPKPAEPTGLGAVVKLRSGHIAIRSCNCGGPDWRVNQAQSSEEPRHWSTLDGAEVLSEGWWSE